MPMRERTIPKSVSTLLQKAEEQVRSKIPARDAEAMSLLMGALPLGGIVVSEANIPKILKQMATTLSGKKKTSTEIAEAFMQARYPRRAAMPHESVPSEQWKKSVAGMFNALENKVSVRQPQRSNAAGDVFQTLAHEKQHMLDFERSKKGLTKQIIPQNFLEGDTASVGGQWSAPEARIEARGYKAGETAKKSFWNFVNKVDPKNTYYKEDEFLKRIMEVLEKK